MIITETVSSNSACSRQNTHYANHRDRPDVNHFIAKLEESVGHLTGAHPAEITLLRFFEQHCSWDNLKNDQFMANFMPMVREATSFTQAYNKTDPKGFHQAAFTEVDGRKVRLSLHQREMTRAADQRAGDPELDEWFFDQKWSVTDEADPNFTIHLQILLHGAYQREIQAHRTAEFVTNQKFPLSTAAGLVGQRFGDVVDSSGAQGIYIGTQMDDWIIGDASNQSDSGIDTNHFTMKLKHP